MKSCRWINGIPITPIIYYEGEALIDSSVSPDYSKRIRELFLYVEIRHISLCDDCCTGINKSRKFLSWKLMRQLIKEIH